MKMTRLLLLLCLTACTGKDGKDGADSTLTVTETSTCVSAVSDEEPIFCCIGDQCDEREELK